MIGRFEVDEPDWPQDVVRMVESHRANVGQPYLAILMFGLWGTPHYSPVLRLYAGYRHLAEQPEDGTAWLELAATHREAAEYAAAERILRELTRLGGFELIEAVYGENLRAHLANLWADAGRPAEALAEFDALREDFGELPIFRHARASVLHDLERYAEAEAEYVSAATALAEEERVASDETTDYPAVSAYLEARRVEARNRRPFGGFRPMHLHSLHELQA